WWATRAPSPKGALCRCCRRRATPACSRSRPWARPACRWCRTTRSAWASRSPRRHACQTSVQWDNPRVSIGHEPLEIAEGVRMLSLRTPTLPPATHTKVFLMGTGEFVLVERASPYPDELARAEAWVEAEGARGLNLKALPLTHHHH